VCVSDAGGVLDIVLSSLSTSCGVGGALPKCHLQCCDAVDGVVAVLR
jgi:hypothetical protein